jgi:hypothetical protein
MRSRYEYEAPSLLQTATLTLKAPLHWRTHRRPWVFDKKSGVRFQLARDEEAALQPLTRRITNGSTPIPIAVAFDHAASALLDRRLGYSSEWDRLARRTPADWNGCLDAGLRRLRW